MPFRPYEIPDQCITFYAEERGPILGEGAIKPLPIPVDQSLIFYTLRIGKLQGEIIIDKAHQRIKYTCLIVPNMRTKEDFFWFNDTRLRNAIGTAHKKMERELPKWVGESHPCGSSHKQGEISFLSRYDRYTISLKWECYP